MDIDVTSIDIDRTSSDIDVTSIRHRLTSIVIDGFRHDIDVTSMREQFVHQKCRIDVISNTIDVISMSKNDT